jgi:hypothetical protein
LKENPTDAAGDTGRIAAELITAAVIVEKTADVSKEGDSE